jgi:integrase
MTERSWSLKWNERSQQFVVRFRKALPQDDEARWGTKRVPKQFARHQELDAERWFMGWYAAHLKTGGLNAPATEVTPATKTIRLLSERWLAYRYEDEGTAVNTHNGFKAVLRNWILTNPRFEHVEIDHLDMERDFTGEVCLAWINSLKGRGTTRLRYAEVLKQMFADCIAHGWANANLHNPFDRPIVAKRLSQLRQEAADERPTIFLSPEQVEVLLTKPNRKVIDYRRLRYLMALATGLRDAEVQGLIWADLRLDAAVPYIWVERQLVRSGPKPATSIKDIRTLGLKKDDVKNYPTAVVTVPKRKSRRAIPLLLIVVQALRFWWNVGWQQYTGRRPEKDDPVFPSGQRNSHQPYGQFCFSESPELLRADLDRLGLPTFFEDSETGGRQPFTFHSLRHTFATLLELGGVERSRIGELLGHRASDVAAKHYIGEVLSARAPLVARLALPDRVQLRGTLIQVPEDPIRTDSSDHLETPSAQVIRLPVRHGPNGRGHARRP